MSVAFCCAHCLRSQGRVSAVQSVQSHCKRSGNLLHYRWRRFQRQVPLACGQCSDWWCPFFTVIMRCTVEWLRTAMYAEAGVVGRINATSAGCAWLLQHVYSLATRELWPYFCLWSLGIRGKHPCKPWSKHYSQLQTPYYFRILRTLGGHVCSFWWVITGPL